jgi:hypothetical protein
VMIARESLPQSLSFAIPVGWWADATRPLWVSEVPLPCC